LQDFDFLSL